MTREENLEILKRALDIEMSYTTPMGPYPVRVKDGGDSNVISNARDIVGRRLRSLLDQKSAPVAPKAPVPVDRNNQQLASGAPVPEDRSHTELKDNGQQQDYVVLSADERAKGFVRPYRDAYRHLKCGKITTMGRAIAETYARDPGFYSGTFCVICGAHYPVGEDGEFVWYEMNGTTGPKVGT